MFKTYRHIKSNGNGYISALIIYLLLLEFQYRWAVLKFFRLFIWQPTLCLAISPYSFTKKALLTLRIVHPFMIIINRNAKIGENCTIYHDVTLGSIETISDKAPQIGNYVYLGCKCSILGEVCIGEHTRVGAHSLVLKSPPPIAL